MNLIYSELPLDFKKYKQETAVHCDEIKQAAHEVLSEESILVSVRPIFHVE